MVYTLEEARKDEDCSASEVVIKEGSRVIINGSTHHAIENRVRPSGGVVSKFENKVS
jgi:hypothetical protein